MKLLAHSGGLRVQGVKNIINKYFGGKHLALGHGSIHFLSTVHLYVWECVTPIVFSLFAFVKIKTPFGVYTTVHVICRATDLGFLFPCHMTKQSPSRAKFNGQI